MTGTDSDRLLKSVLISFGIHFMLFAGISLFDLFPDTSAGTNIFQPVKVVISKKTEPVPEPPEEVEAVTEPVSRSAPVQPPPAAESGGNPAPAGNVSSEGTPSRSVPAAAEPDPYADLFLPDETSDIPLRTLPEDTAEKPVYVPSSKSEVVADTLADSTTKPENYTEQNVPAGENSSPVLSAGELEGLEASLQSGAGETKTASGTDDRSLYTYQDAPYSFDDASVNRRLISEPVINIPPDQISMLGSEAKIVIGFTLGSDGSLKYLKTLRSSGYPQIDNSVMSELRKWLFNKDEGAAEVTGTVTIILKAVKN